MTHSPSDVIRNYLVNLMICSQPSAKTDWPGFVSFLKDQPDEAILISDTTARNDGRFLRTGKTIEHPGIQVLIRGTDHQSTWSKANEIITAFDAVARAVVSINSSTYLLEAVTRRGGIISLSMEEHFKALERQLKEVKQGRFIFVINAITTITEE